MVLAYTEYREKEKRLILALILALVIGLLEVVGGIISNSLALISDSIHVFMDVVAITIALVAVRLALKPHTPTLTYGYHRVEVLAAFINTALAVALSIILLYETYMRLLEPRVIDWGYMLMIAVAGLAVNLIMLRILKHGHGGLNEEQMQGQGQGQERYGVEEHEHGMLIKSVSLHIVSDILGSLAVISAGAVIALTSLSIVDVIASVIIVGLILRLALQMLKRCIIILLEGAPEGIDIVTIMDEIRSINGVVDIHDVHVWSIAPSMPSLSAHVTIRNDADAKEVMRNINTVLSRYGIKHTTVQIEEEELIRPDRLGSEQGPGSDSQVVRQPRDLMDE
ncbi:putative Cadmium, cobalt and zinc/H(+)-K(+) antiporter [Candidatus Nitrosocaldus cavascurensis]|uniref:Putative Cadmium, cobalt and zinc/H(+)-K(+) antiporter n=1 Tax=Candidatus Nitrosocaldus cavascurensis TaxID=2058097 RepID=A0A2K5APQ3_9ARCH|nr:putative Cadmium, cobalt and zinc/H(+)-K(+) antiporter [Candidatus Nitrosocaldus cavascurensis]